MRPIHVLFSLILIPLLFGTAAAGAGATKDPDAAEAKGRLATLKAAVRSRKSTELEVISALDDVAEVYASVGKDARVRDAYRKQADLLFVRALTRWRSPRGATKPNRHEMSCLHAAETIGRAAAHLAPKARKSLSARVQLALEQKLLQATTPELEDVSDEQLEASLAAMARINAPTAIEWYLKRFMHTKVGELRLLRAAHKSLLLFHHLPGALRRALVKTIINRYAGVESRAHRGQTVSDRAAKRFWDEMKLHTIPALQRFAGSPTNEKGEALATVKAFQGWWRDHKKLRDEAWRD